MNAVMTEVAGEAAARLAPLLHGGTGPSGRGSGGTGPEVGAAPQDPVVQLWSLLSGYPKVRAVATARDEYLREDLTREIGRVLEHNRPLLTRVTELVGQARAADPVHATG